MGTACLFLQHLRPQLERSKSRGGVSCFLACLLTCLVIDAVAWDHSWGHGLGPYLWLYHVIVWTSTAWCLDSKGKYAKDGQVETIAFYDPASKSYNFISAGHQPTWIQGEGTKDLNSWWEECQRGAYGMGDIMSSLENLYHKHPQNSFAHIFPRTLLIHHLAKSCLLGCVHTFRCVSRLLGLNL